MSTRFEEQVTFSGGIKVPGGYDTDIKRSEMEQNTSAIYTVPWEVFRTWDSYATNLPGTAADDDLALEGNTFATGSPAIEAGDLKAAGSTTRYARFGFVLPAEYDDGETVTLRFYAGMQTTVADTECTLDVAAYEPDYETGIGSDLVATAATTDNMNSTTFANIDFTITSSGLVSGDMLDCRASVLCNDAATGTAVIPTIGRVMFLLDIRG